MGESVPSRTASAKADVRWGAEERALLDRARDIVLAVEPGARIVLYGSRARGTAELESDWDLLILLAGPVDARRRKSVLDRLFALELDTGAVLSAMVYGKDVWDSARLRVQPFRANVEDDGLELAGGGERDGADAPRLPTEADMAEAREDLIREWLGRAREALDEARELAERGHWNGCVNRLYYACFDAARALLVQRNYRFSKHSSVQSLLNRDFGKTGILAPDLMDLYNTLFKARGAADYEPFARFQEAEVRPWRDGAQRWIALIESVARSPNERESEA
jgi:uncharacterized protein (UPF0332 family)/predicted nucleotidyltransferase